MILNLVYNLKKNMIFLQHNRNSAKIDLEDLAQKGGVPLFFSKEFAGPFDTFDTWPMYLT